MNYHNLPGEVLNNIWERKLKIIVFWCQKELSLLAGTAPARQTSTWTISPTKTSRTFTLKSKKYRLKTKLCEKVIDMILHVFVSRLTFIKATDKMITISLQFTTRAFIVEKDVQIGEEVFFFC